MSLFISPYVGLFPDAHKTSSGSSCSEARWGRFSLYHLLEVGCASQKQDLLSSQRFESYYDYSDLHLQLFVLPDH